MKSYIYFFGVIFAIFEVAVSVSISVSVVDTPALIGETAVTEKRYVTDYKCEYNDYVSECFDKCKEKDYYYSYCNTTTRMCTCTNVVDGDLQKPTEVKCEFIKTVPSLRENCAKKYGSYEQAFPFCNITTDMCICTITRGLDLIQATNIECKGIPPAPPQTCVDKCKAFKYQYAYCDSKFKNCTCSAYEPDDNTSSLVKIEIDL